MGQIIELPRRAQSAGRPSYLVVGPTAERAVYLRVIAGLVDEFEECPREKGVCILAAAAHLYGTALPDQEQLACALERLASSLRSATRLPDPEPPRAA